MSYLQTFPPTVAQAPQAEVKIRRLIKAWERLEGSTFLKSTEQDKIINLPLLFLRTHHSAITTRMTKQLLEAFVFVAYKCDRLKIFLKS